MQIFAVFCFWETELLRCWGAKHKKPAKRGLTTHHLPAGQDHQNVQHGEKHTELSLQYYLCALCGSNSLFGFPDLHLQKYGFEMSILGDIPDLARYDPERPSLISKLDIICKIGPAFSSGVDQMVLSNQNYSQTATATAVSKSSASNRYILQKIIYFLLSTQNYL